MQKSTDIISVCALDTHPRTNHSCLSITLRLLRSSTHCQKTAESSTDTLCSDVHESCTSETTWTVARCHDAWLYHDIRMLPVSTSKTTYRLRLVTAHVAML